MIFLQRREPVLRAGEIDVAGRRIAARAIPCVGEAGPPPFRFDPVARTMVLRPSAGRVEAGPADAETWARAVRRVPGGPILVGPGYPDPELQDVARAAAEGAREAGRAAYLLDFEPAGLPGAPGEAFVALFAGIPDEPLWRRLEAAAARMPAGLLLPILPGWTAEEQFLDAVLEQALQSGASFIAAIAVAGDGESRRRAVAARGLVEPGSEEAFFDRVHHGDWEGETGRASRRLREGGARRGLAVRPPRPRGEAEPSGNALAAGRLEELADRDASNEHRAALLRAAVRWLDEGGRDLRPVVAEGNFRKIFPFDPEIAPEVERALTSPAP